MNRGTIILVMIGVLIVGGFFTLQLLASGPDGALPVRIQTLNPEASTAVATPNQALAFLIFAAVAVGSLIGGGAVLAFAFRAMDREINKNKAG